jgi:hypothetical protein
MSVATKFGKAYVDSQGYLRISSIKEGNHVDEEKVKRAFDEKTAERIVNTIQSEAY